MTEGIYASKISFHRLQLDLPYGTAFHRTNHRLYSSLLAQNVINLTDVLTFLLFYRKKRVLSFFYFKKLEK